MPRRICLVTAELAPFAKTGGLGDAVAGLARFLSLGGAEVRVFVPDYASADYQGQPVVPVDFLQDLDTEIAGRRLRYGLRTTTLPGSSAAVYLVRCPAAYGRQGIYDGRGDEHLRFALLSRATIEACQRMGFGPDVFHCNDWHTALLPLYLRTVYGWDRHFAASRTLLTIHNLAFQGIFPASAAGEVGLGAFASLLHQDELAAGRFSFMTSGILYADHLSTVSETYAREIQTPALGFGLDALLRSRADHLEGIVNGVDYGEWDPRDDPYIQHPYSAADLDPKERNKQALLDEVGLRYDPAAPVLAVVSRLTAQKGLDLLFEALPDALAQRDVRCVVLGSGERRYEDFFARLAQHFPGRASFHRGFNNPLAHRIQAGADIFLMPSRYEPCGLSQLYSLRYGTVPLVRRTGGLADTVELYDSATGRGTGFVFEHFDADGMRWALDYALRSFPDRVRWRNLQHNGMERDFSWMRQGVQYEELYDRIAAA